MRISGSAVGLLRARRAADAVQKINESLDRYPLATCCSACGSSEQFSVRPVIGRRLARQWGLDRTERAMVDIQQGHLCEGCGNNLRGRCLADAILARLGIVGPLTTAWDRASATRILEVNPAARLTPMLSKAAHHVCTSYPEVDIQALPFRDGEFDLVVHSDTLEHVPDPALAIRECLRVAGSGWVVFTTPVLFDRLTRDRTRRPASYHGGDSGPSLVYWEFGADVVTFLLEAQATEIVVNRDGYPYACAFSCRRSG
ncbi:class I SAM-dependent methyltransferase [Plantactinospora sonchi]|uniref:Methyltransferase domain-containing protein n=1 Tax=Plantactinospora sonchi TaxID=1544735 RepID=A0ABU7RRC4_9ACTN